MLKNVQGVPRNIAVERRIEVRLLSLNMIMALSKILELIAIFLSTSIFKMWSTFFSFKISQDMKTYVHNS